MSHRMNMDFLKYDEQTASLARQIMKEVMEELESSHLLETTFVQMHFEQIVYRLNEGKFDSDIIKGFFKQIIKVSFEDKTYWYGNKV
jgi:ethanolamine utilization protein EutQ (cupin superfamily)